MGELASTLDSLAGEDPHAMFGPQLLERLGELLRIHGGATSLQNSALLCERHTQVHHGFRIERDDGGRWHTHRPGGTEIRIPSDPSPAGPCPVGARPGS